jgi:hypothetical protein
MRSRYGGRIPGISRPIDANRGQQWLQQQVRDMVAEAEAVDGNGRYFFAVRRWTRRPGAHGAG